MQHGCLIIVSIVVDRVIVDYKKNHDIEVWDIVQTSDVA